MAKEIRQLPEVTAPATTDWFIIQKSSNNQTSKVSGVNIRLAITGLNNSNIEAQQAWQTATLENSWVDVSSASYGVAAYMKDTLGFVHLQGYVKSGTATVGVALFTLPVGYRPSTAINVPTMAGTASSSNYGALQIGTGGTVGYLVGGNAGMSLTGIIFKAA